ncbi:transposase [Bosea sp. CRIB-10]|uniref:IS66-like element accessory protein TnpA n=1 Tax=Bosea sp. CRIB-10 TaxID=378404 RepID=UPI000A70242E|nr:transposase [Bosea sp. CRIB-10]
MDVYTDTPISRLEIVERGGRRRFSDEAKLRIVEESYSGRRLGSATARKYAITRSQLNDWRDAARAGRLGPASNAGFIPAVIVPEVAATTSPPMADGSRIEIVTANGRRVIVDGSVDVDALLRIVRGLETLR